jgi:FSR family fosmidomycin resistance protein-like MFS transporter
MTPRGKGDLLSQPHEKASVTDDPLPEALATEGERFATGRVATFAAGHAIHDTYTGFLPPLLPALISKLALSKTEAGLLTVFLQSPSILQPFIGYLADRISLRYLVFLAPGITATMMSLAGAAPSYVLLALVLLIAGISSAGMHAVGPVMAGRMSDRNLGRGMSFWMVGGELGRTLGPIVIVTGIGMLTLEGLPWLMIGGWLTSALLLFRLRNVSGRPPSAGKVLPWRSALSQMRPLMVPLAALLIVRAFMSASITTYLPTFLSEEGADLWWAGASLSILEAAGILGALLGGSLSDRWGRRLILFLSMLSSPILLFLFLGFDGWGQTAMLPLLGFAHISVTPVIMALVQESYPENRALANGIYMAMSFLVRSVVVVLLGGVGDLFGLRQGYILSGALMLLGTPLILLLPQTKNRADEW